MLGHGCSVAEFAAGLVVVSGVLVGSAGACAPSEVILVASVVPSASTSATSGAPARDLLERAVRRAGPVFPWGTFIVNLSGESAISVVTGAALEPGFPAEARAIGGTGLRRADTTFSTDTHEIARRGDDGQPRVAAVDARASVVLGVALTAAGLVVTGAL